MASGAKLSRALWVASGGALIICLAAFVAISRGIGPRRLHVPILVLAIAVQLVGVWRAPVVRASRRVLAYLLVIAVVARVLVLLMPGSREGDYFRYLWDGALIANGVNPYSVSPEQAIQREVGSAAVLELAEEGAPILQGINHPQLRTIYPPFAQVLFALAYWVKPFSSGSWTAVLALTDVFTGCLILVLLSSAGLPVTAAAAYLWHPLLIVETYHYHHLDVALSPFLLLFVWGLSRSNARRASFNVAAAAGLKLWPLILFPFLVFRFWRDRSRLVTAGLVFALLLAALFLPYWFAIRNADDSGAVAYAKTWNANELAYRILDSVGWRTSRMLGYPVDGRVVARAALLIILTATCTVLAWKTRAQRLTSLSAAVGAIILLMLLLTPTLYPWYFVPAVALAPLVPQPYFLAWSVLLPLTALTRSVEHPLLLLAVIHGAGWVLFTSQIVQLWRRRIDA